MHIHTLRKGTSVNEEPQENPHSKSNIVPVQFRLPARDTTGWPHKTGGMESDCALSRFVHSSIPARPLLGFQEIKVDPSQSHPLNGSISTSWYGSRAGWDTYQKPIAAVRLEQPQKCIPTSMRHPPQSETRKKNGRKPGVDPESPEAILNRPSCSHKTNKKWSLLASKHCWFAFMSGHSRRLMEPVVEGSQRHMSV